MMKRPCQVIGPVRGISIVWLVVLGVVTPAASWAAAVHVEDRSECLDPFAVRAALEETLRDHDAGTRGLITVVGNRGEAATIVTLRVVTVLGEIVLERRFELRPEDCASATELLAAVLDRFLQDFPRAQWGEALPESKSSPPPPPPKRVVVTQDVTGFSGLVLVGVDSRWLPASGDVELGLAVDVGASNHGLAASAIVRLGLPQELEGGHFVEVLGLLGVGWCYAGPNTLARVEVRTGGLLAAGFGYPTNHHNWLPWLEIQGSWTWQWKGLLLGPQLGVSPLRHRVRTIEGGQADLPWIRVGLLILFPIWSPENLKDQESAGE